MSGRVSREEVFADWISARKSGERRARPAPPPGAPELAERAAALPRVSLLQRADGAARRGRELDHIVLLHGHETQAEAARRCKSLLTHMQSPRPLAGAVANTPLRRIRAGRDGRHPTAAV